MPSARSAFTRRTDAARPRHQLLPSMACRVVGGLGLLGCVPMALPAAVGIAALAALAPAAASEAKTDWAVLVEATSSSTPASITLSWPLEPRATAYEIQRKRRSDATWGGTVPTTLSSPPETYADWRRPIAQLPGTATGWTDTTTEAGVVYEYEVLRTSTIPREGQAPGNQWPTPVTGRNCWGYIAAGIDVPVVDHRGTVILLVDETMATPLANELARLHQDLVGDGWSVIRHDVPRGSTDATYDTRLVAQVKSLVAADYHAGPDEVKSIFILGHVPVPRGGAATFDGHPEHRGAIPTDRFYADMHTVFTDVGIDTRDAFYQSAPPYSPQLENVPGDGKFDQWVLADRAYPAYDSLNDWRPAHIDNQELEVGRVDLWGMSAFAPLTELDLLRRYLDKDHDHRHGVTVLPRRAIIDGDKIYYPGSMWSSWSGLVGRDRVARGTFADVLAGGALGFWIQGAGSNDWIGAADQAVSTGTLAQQDPHVAFWSMMGSHLYDYDYANNIMRGALATTTGLSCFWSGETQWTLHTLEMGGTLGEMARLNENNGMLHIGPWFHLYNHWSEDNGRIHVNLLGDPTLRLYAVQPAPSATAEPGTDNVALSWAASPDHVVGYHVYRSTGMDAPFVRLTTVPLAQLAWTDRSLPGAGTYTYLVRAIKNEVVPTGNYFNASQGAFATAAYTGKVGWTPRPATHGSAATATAAKDKAGSASVVGRRFEGAVSTP